MSRKTSSRDMISELAKDPEFMKAFEIIRHSLTPNFTLDDIYNSEDEVSDDEDTSPASPQVIHDSDDSDVPELCSCNNCIAGQCHKLKAQNKLKKKSQEVQSKVNDKALIRKKLTELAMALIDSERQEEDSQDSNDEFDGSESLADAMESAEKKTDDNMGDMLSEKEKRKKRSERKKLQKKKKKEKRKAEKLLVELSGQNSRSEAKTKPIDKNSNKSNKNVSDNNNISKDDTKTNNKAKKNNDGMIGVKNKKEIDNGSSSKVDTNSRESLSVKSSPRSEAESEGMRSDAEEEELAINSAYVSQIAQRKNKPSYIQKTAQTVNPNDAQDLWADGTGPALRSHKAFSDNNSIKSNNSDSFVRINSNLNIANYTANNSKTLPTTTLFTGNSRDVDEDFPKYKQYFFDNQKQKPQKTLTVPLTKDEINQNKEKSVDLAKLANYKAENGLFVEAIELFSQAIDLNVKDYRFYVNRSYCYDSIQDFRNALKDAEIAIKLKPDWPKCHYRKGKALAGLKNYQESEIALKKVLELESNCEEALQELKKVRQNAIIDTGYDQNTAEQYASEYDSITEALKALTLKTENQKTLNTNNGIKNTDLLRNVNNWWNSANNSANIRNGAKTGHKFDDDDIYISDDEFNCFRTPTYQETEPTNPFGWKALWVGNVSATAKLETVTTMFRKFGNLNYCNIFKGNNGGNFILIHYDNPDSPKNAMAKYQGKVIPGVSITDIPLTIRFRPNRDQKKPNYDQRLESDECYYWRTTGCARGDNCMFKHITANKGVDKQAWMCNPLKKGNFKSQK